MLIHHHMGPVCFGRGLVTFRDVVSIPEREEWAPPRSKDSPIRDMIDWLQEAYLLSTGSSDQQEWHDKEKKGPVL